MKNIAKVIVKAHHEKRLIEGNPWIFSNEIENFSSLKNLEKGSLIEVEIYKQPHFALAYFNPNSLISCRILSYNSVEKIDESFFVKKINKAQILREKFFDKPFYRLVNSEGDRLPGLIIDRFDNIFVCQISTAGMENLKPFLILALKEIFKNCQIIFRNNSELRALEKLESSLDFECVDDVVIPEKITVIENDLQFTIDLKNGQKTGWFFDQRINRDFVASISKDCDVLDAFCYLGGFGLNALKGGAKSVTFVDSSDAAISKIKNRNLENVDAICDKVFDFLENTDKKFDVVLLDPPAFIKNKKDFFSGIKGYEKLIKLGAAVTKKGGILMISSCSHHASLADLTGTANNAFRKTNRAAKLIRVYGAGYDHPLHPALKESEYLKSITFLVE